MSRLKGRKAPGTRGVMPEMLKAGREVAIEWLVKQFLRVVVSGDGSMQREVEARIGCASRVIGGMSQAILRRQLSKQTKLKVVNAMVISVLMYGCETLAVRKEQKSKIQAMRMNMLSIIEGVGWKDQITNDEILQIKHGASRGTGYGEEETGGVERKIRRDGQ